MATRVVMALGSVRAGSAIFERHPLTASPGICFRHACGYALANRPRHQGTAGLPRTQEPPAYGALYRAVAAAVQGFEGGYGARPTTDDGAGPSATHLGARLSVLHRRWEGDRLLLRSSGRQLATIRPDSEWPVLYRIELPGGRLSDVANKTRAKDAAVSIALTTLDSEVAAKAAA
jgi:hypothetical protein